MIIRKSTVHVIGKSLMGNPIPIKSAPYNSLLYSSFLAAIKTGLTECMFFKGFNGPGVNDNPYQERMELAKGTIVTLFQE